jgi:hypothetical protein
VAGENVLRLGRLADPRLPSISQEESGRQIAERVPAFAKGESGSASVSCIAIDAHCWQECVHTHMHKNSYKGQSCLLNQSNWIQCFSQNDYEPNRCHRILSTVKPSTQRGKRLSLSQRALLAAISKTVAITMCQKSCDGRRSARKKCQDKEHNTNSSAAGRRWRLFGSVRGSSWREICDANR